MRLLVMADGKVGEELVDWLLDNYPEDIGIIITTSQNNLFNKVKSKKINCHVYNTEEKLIYIINELNISIDLGLLLWWPKIIKKSLLNLPTYGFINTHPSLLPYNRGKHYNFWALVEQSPFGVSLHFVDEGIDSGDIIFQSKIDYDWEDTGESLYKKASHEMVKLFKKSYLDIRAHKFNRLQQVYGAGSIHYANEIDSACMIDLNKIYKARDLINLLRARTFEGHPSCWFIDNENKYEIKIKINKK